MAAETLSTNRSAATMPARTPQGEGEVAFTYGVYEIGGAVEDGDIFEMCRIPAGCSVVDGFVRADDIDTDASEALDMDVGWAANGVEAANSDGFGDLGVWTGDAVAGVKPETGVYFPFFGVLKDGPKAFTNETVIQLEANAAATAGHVGTVYVGVYYIRTPQVTD